MSRVSERRKAKAEKGKDEKEEEEEETLKHEKPHFFWWGCFMAIFDYKIGDFFRFLTQTCPPTEVTFKNMTYNKNGGSFFTYPIAVKTIIKPSLQEMVWRN